MIVQPLVREIQVPLGSMHGVHRVFRGPCGDRYIGDVQVEFVAAPELLVAFTVLLHANVAMAG
jgi:hypothetical protein